MSGRLRDHTVEQNWSAYTEEEHAIWRLLFEHQQKLLKGRACREYLEGLDGLGVAAHRLRCDQERDGSERETGDDEAESTHTVHVRNPR